MSSFTDEQKSRLSKILKDLEVPEIQLSEKGRSLLDLLKTAKQNADQPDGLAEQQNVADSEELIIENPYKVNSERLREIELKLTALSRQKMRDGRVKSSSSVESDNGDNKRPWRTNAPKEQLLRINNELKDRASRTQLELIRPLSDDEMSHLIQSIREENEADANRDETEATITDQEIKELVKDALINMPNYQQLESGEKIKENVINDTN